MAKKAKAVAVAVAVPQSKNEASDMIRALGDTQRDLDRTVGAMNDAIAAITNDATPQINELKGKISALTQGIQIYAEANRSALTDSYKVKTANLVTGEVAWRFRPPSVAVRGADAVVAELLRRNLARFVREKREVNKEAILNEPAAVIGVPGLTVESGVEDFVVTPFAQEVEGV